MFSPKPMSRRSTAEARFGSVLLVAAALMVCHLTASPVHAEEPDAEVPQLVPRHTLLFDGALTNSDPLVGGTYRYALAPNGNLGFFGTFAMRPQTKTVIDQIAPHFFYQREENRYLGAAGLDLVYPRQSVFGISASAGVGYSIGDYEGTRASPESGFTPLLRGGLLLRGRLGAGSWGVLRLGYQYLDLKTSDPHFAYLSIGAEF
jgi:hypothetical protein